MKAKKAVTVTSLDEAGPVLARWHNQLREDIQAKANEGWSVGKRMRWLDGLRAEAMAKGHELTKHLRMKDPLIDDAILAINIHHEWLRILSAEYQRLFDSMTVVLEQAREWERAAQADKAIGGYEALVQEEFAGSLPYDRLRILYTKRRQFQDALRVCDMYLALPDRAHGQDKNAFRIHRQELVRKLNKAL